MRHRLTDNLVGFAAVMFPSLAHFALASQAVNSRRLSTIACAIRTRFVVIGALQAAHAFSCARAGRRQKRQRFGDKTFQTLGRGVDSVRGKKKYVRNRWSLSNIPDNLLLTYLHHCKISTEVVEKPLWTQAMASYSLFSMEACKIESNVIDTAICIP